MKINENISDSLKYPIKNWVKTILLGIILIIPILNFIGLGYYLRIIKSNLAGLNELPNFERVRELFVDGIKILIVGIIYAIVPLIFYTLSFAFPGPLFPIIASISAIIISIFAYMGLANMAYHNSEIGAALRYDEILARIAAIVGKIHDLVDSDDVNYNSCRNYYGHSWRNIVILCLGFSGLFIGIWLLNNIPSKICCINI